MTRPLILLALPLAVAAADVRAQPPSAQTTDFITKASTTDAFEIEAGRLAEKRSKNAEVRSFGAMMVKDHTRTTGDLRQILVKDRLPMPGKASPDPTQAKLLADLRATPRSGFDKAYMHTQVVAHQTALMVMQDYAQHGDNADLKKAASKTAPLVQHHLDMALKLEGKVGGPPKNTTRRLD